MKTPEMIFYLQSKMFALDGCSDMLQDFAARCIMAGHAKDAVVAAVSEYYSQCAEIAENKYIQALKIVGRFRADNS